MSATKAMAFAALSLLLLAATPSPQPPWEQGGDQEPEGRNTKSAQSKKSQQPAQEGSPVPVHVETNLQPTADATHAEEKHEQDCCGWYAAFGPPTWSNWALLLVAVGAGAIAMRTLRLEYRPWVVATGDGELNYAIKENIGEGSVVEMLDDARPESNVPFRIDLKNAGKTPALGLTIKLEWQNSEWTNDMPKHPQYGGQRSKHFTIGAIGPGIVHEHRAAFDEFPIEVRRTIEIGFRFTVCGLIEYRGPRPSPTYTTKFCLLYQGPEGPFCISGPYNDCT